MAEDLNKCQSEKVMETGAAENKVVASGSSSKKRKFESISDEFENGNVNLTNLNLEEDEAAAGTETETETETSMYNANSGSTTIEIFEESEESEMEISPSAADLGEVITPPIKLSEEELQELEEFFSAAEKQLQKKFAEKYNFDIVNDVPMEGRFRWVARMKEN